MLTNKDLAGNPEWYFSSGTFGYDWYCVGDMHNSRTGEQGIGVKIDFTEVGKDELDALYRIQRIIEDKIHEVRMRPVQVENGNLPDVEVLFPDDEPVANTVASVEKHYTIYHAIGSNAFHEVEDQERLYAGWLYATSLEDAFRKSQNTDKPWRNTKTRSTSVGDVIKCNNERYMVTGTGFRLLQLPEDTAWKDLDRAHQEDLKNEADLNAFEAQNC